MGREFLRHVERCRVLLFLVDVTDPDPLGSYETVRNEILRYDTRLLEKPCLLAFTKCDLLGGGIDTILPDMPGKSLSISAVGRQGLDELVGALINALG